MKHLILSYSIILLISANIFAQKNQFINKSFKDEKAKSQFFLHLADNYNSNALSILKSTKKYQDYTRWANGKKHDEMLRNYGTVIHETCHGYNFSIGGFEGAGYFIAPDIQIVATKTKVFKSNELDKEIPKEWKKNIFRYKTYVKGETGMIAISSITDGIYGMMDEFDAYYQDTRAIIELFDYYKTFASYSAPEDWTNYLSNCYSNVYAYYEFRLFMAWYLKHAKKKYPEIFKNIIQNKKLKVIYSLVNNGYIKTIEKYFKNRNTIIDNINKVANKSASISGDYLNIKTKDKYGHSSYGIGVPDSKIAYLKSLYTKEDQQMLELLYIKGISEQNYKSYY